MASLIGLGVTDLAQQVKFNLSMKEGSQTCKFQSEESLDTISKFNLKSFKIYFGFYGMYIFLSMQMHYRLSSLLMYNLIKCPFGT